MSAGSEVFVPEMGVFQEDVRADAVVPVPGQDGAVVAASQLEERVFAREMGVDELQELFFAFHGFLMG